MFHFHFGGKSAKDSSLQLELAELKRQESARAQSTLDALQRGELPPTVVTRIRSQNAGDLPWTSDLSVNEWALLSRYRLETLGQVMGSSFYHVGFVPNYAFGFIPVSQELEAPTQALYEGRHLALSRMAQEASLMGAHAVVGVRLEAKGFNLEEHMFEYVCFGTAIRVEGLAPSNHPTLCTVSGQDFVRLLVAGAMPIGLALGGSFYYLRTDWWSQRQSMSWYNQEMQQFQRAVSDIRRLTMQRMREDVRKLGGSGVLGADYHLDVKEISGGKTNDDQEIVDHILEAIMIGTVVDRGQRPASMKIDAVLDLSK